MKDAFGKYVLACLSLSALLWLNGCATNPVTGSRDFVMLSEEQELALGRQANAQVLKQYSVYPNKKWQEYVQRVGRKLAAKSHRPGLIYHFTVVDSKEVNAFALPGGYIYFTRGLLSYMTDEAQMAAVLGHEIGHVTARHSVRQHSAAQATSLGAMIGSIFLPQLASQAGSALVNMIGTAALSGYGRKHELESDRLGAEYLARSGYAPTAMIDVIRILKNQELFDLATAKEEGREPRRYHGLFASHPDNDTRLKQVVGLANKYLTTEPQIQDKQAFYDMLDGLVVGDSAREGIVRGQSFYHPDLGFGLRFPRGWHVKNLPSQLLITAPGGEAVMQLAAQDRNRRISPRDFMLTRMKLKSLQSEGPISPAGLPGHSAVASVNTSEGRREARINVIYFNDKAYIIAGLVKNPRNIAAHDRAFLDTAKSFHPLTQQERKLAQPLHIKVIRAKSGTSFRKLAAASPLTSHPEKQLRLLNNMFPSGEPKPGQLLKIVQ